MWLSVAWHEHVCVCDGGGGRYHSRSDEQLQQHLQIAALIKLCYAA